MNYNLEGWQPYSSQFEDSSGLNPDFLQRRPVSYFSLTVEQQPQSGKALEGKEKDRKPIDPPPILRLELQNASNQSNASIILTSPYLFLSATLEPCNHHNDSDSNPAKGEVSQQLSGNKVSSLSRIKDLESRETSVFVFPELFVQSPGWYVLRFELHDMGQLDNEFAPVVASAVSEAFQVYTSRTYPGIRGSTPLTRALCDQGIRIRCRKESKQVSKRKTNQKLAKRSASLLSSKSVSAEERVVVKTEGKSREPEGKHVSMSYSRPPRATISDPMVTTPDLQQSHEKLHVGTIHEGNIVNQAQSLLKSQKAKDAVSSSPAGDTRRLATQYPTSNPGYIETQTFFNPLHSSAPMPLQLDMSFVQQQQHQPHFHTSPQDSSGHPFLPSYLGSGSQQHHQDFTTNISPTSTMTPTGFSPISPFVLASGTIANQDYDYAGFPIGMSLNEHLQAMQAYNNNHQQAFPDSFFGHANLSSYHSNNIAASSMYPVSSSSSSYMDYSASSTTTTNTSTTTSAANKSVDKFSAGDD